MNNAIDKQHKILFRNLNEEKKTTVPAFAVDYTKRVNKMNEYTQKTNDKLFDNFSVKS